jgi:cytoplasmic FMR1 interacting protein
MILDRAPHWNKSKYDMNYADEETKVELEKSYLLINQFEEISSSYKSIVASLQIFKNQLAKNSDFADVNKICYEVSLKTVKYLSFLTTKVIEQTAWKYLNPSESEDTQTLKIGIYEKAVLYNYRPDEKKVLLIVISMIKDLAAMLYSLEPKIKSIIEAHIKNDIDTFSEDTLLSHYQTAVKKKRATAPYVNATRDYIFRNREFQADNDKHLVISESQVLWD